MRKFLYTCLLLLIAVPFFAQETDIQHRLKQIGEVYFSGQPLKALEEYIKDIFAGTVNEIDDNIRNQKLSEAFTSTL